MKYNWRLYWLWCSYVFISSFLIIGNQGIASEVTSFRLAPDMFNRVRSTADPPLKSRNIILELKNSNILRDVNAHPVNVDGSRSVLSDVKSTRLNDSEIAAANSEQVSSLVTDQHPLNRIKDDISNPTIVPSINNNEDHANFVDSWLRNTRDLGFDPTVSNGTDEDPNHSSFTDSKLTNNSVYIVGTDITTPVTSEKNETIMISLQNTNNTAKQTDKYSDANSKTVRLNPTTPSSFVKNKDKEIKSKLEANSKPLKKLAANTKSKLNVAAENSTLVSNKTENVTENSNHIPSNNSLVESITRNITVLPMGVNGESSNSSKSNVSSSSRQTMPELKGIQTISVALIIVAAVAVISTITGIGMLSVMLYRRYHWNKPQTFSDKCSNADSTGYIDDSTLKENSEEMYSLDNDSFLNSLEAMTIQNYWADSIRHTKL